MSISNGEGGKVSPYATLLAKRARQSLQLACFKDVDRCILSDGNTIYESIQSDFAARYWGKTIGIYLLLFWRLLFV